MTQLTRSSEMHRVVVTGLGAITPLGLSVDDFWNGLMNGESGGGPITKFDTEAFSTKIACELQGFDPEDYMDRKQARRLDPYAQYALAAAQHALAHADIDTENLSEEERDRTGVIFGTGIGGVDLFQEQTEVYLEHGPRRLSPFFVPMMIANMGAGLIAMEHGLRGPNHCVVSACATGNDAINDAVLLLRHGHADAMVAGGTEASINPLCIGGFGSMKALSTRNDDPKHASRPFDKDRDGFVSGEGSAALILETLEHAEARGATIYAEIAGIGKSNDAHHYAAPDPNGRGAMLAMQSALRDADLDTSDVAHINMHATSTPLGDVAETDAIKGLFGEAAYDLNLSATKSMTGHLLGAAGAAEAIATILAIYHNRIPPTINVEETSPECDLNYTLGEPVDREVNVALSNAFGFGGHNTTLAFKRFDA